MKTKPHHATTFEQYPSLFQISIPITPQTIHLHFISFHSFYAEKEMQKEEKMVSCNPPLRRPKQEEVPILEDGNSSQKPIDPDGKGNIMEDLECIFGFQDDHKFGGAGHMLTNEWDFMTWDEISNVGLKEECDDVDPDDHHRHHKMKMEEEPFEECDNDGNIAVKRENLGFWEEKKTISLNLNYQDVLDAWSDGRSPWAHDYSLLTSNDTYMGEVPVMEEGKKRREARVLRYKEKRQSRLFSKKIRYQVRKLNAEKRPRLKGRFVKRIPDKIVR